jgi:V/A-type H+/Na+-transporting ATPase subunit I
VSVAPVSKVHIFVHSGRKAGLLSALQETGLVHLEEAKFEGVDLRRKAVDASDADRTLARLKHALDVFAAMDETPGLKRIFRPKPELSLKTRSGALACGHFRVLDELERLESERNALSADLKHLDREAEFLEPLRDVALPLDAFRGTRTAEVRLFVVPASEAERLEEKAAEGPFWFEVVSRDKRSCRVVGVFPRESADEAETFFEELGAEQVDLDARVAAAGPGKRIEDLLAANRLERDRKAIAAEGLETGIRALAVHAPALMPVHDLLMNERERLVADRLLGDTEAVSCVEGWVRTADRDLLEKKVAEVSNAAQVCFREPLPEEEPPVFLENPKALRPFEIITNLYGLPDKGILDPTIPLAPFFFIYVGLCVSEGGYGFLVALLSLLYLKLARPRGGAKKFAILALYLGISNIILGTLFGGWFGFPIKPLLLIDALKDPIPFLALSIALGFIQVWFGTLLSAVDSFRNKAYLESIFVKGGWLVLLPSLILYFVTKHPAAGLAALIGASGVVFFAAPSRNPLSRFFGGLYSLYGISGYVSDTLSYSRILALGLSTGVIGMVINNLTATAFRIPVAGWVLAPILFVGGHLFNLGIGFLGGFVHSMRLQFVEFFTKFYKGGGRPFKPLRLENKYVEFVE